MERSSFMNAPGSRLRFCEGEKLVVLREVAAGNPFEDEKRWNDVVERVGQITQRPFRKRTIKGLVGRLLHDFQNGGRATSTKFGEPSERNQLLHVIADHYKKSARRTQREWDDSSRRLSVRALESLQTPLPETPAINALERQVFAVVHSSSVSEPISNSSQGQSAAEPSATISGFKEVASDSEDNEVLPYQSPNSLTATDSISFFPQSERTPLQNEETDLERDKDNSNENRRLKLEEDKLQLERDRLELEKSRFDLERKEREEKMDIERKRFEVEMKERQERLKQTAEEREKLLNLLTSQEKIIEILMSKFK